MKRIFMLFFLAVSAPSLMADVKMPRIFSDHMVLQRDKPLIIWGWADPKEKITVSFGKQRQSVSADRDGKWKIVLSPEAAGGPYELVVKGKNTLIYKDVLMGDVWVCSGQSNMEWPVRASDRAVEEIASANFPTIRQIKVPTTIASEPKQDFSGGEWKVCSPAEVGNFTAVGYFFARELNKELNVPIGLINTTWGGTMVETWTSREAFENAEEFRNMINGMPKLDLALLAKEREQRMLAAIGKLQEKIPSPGETQPWKDPAFDDRGWKTMTVPGLWENQLLPDFDGVIWFRKEFVVLPQDAGKEGILNLAMVDDDDITYVNGVKVGSVQQWNQPRRYTIPAGVLKEGKNVVAVRVEDTGGGGGIHGDAADLNITVGQTNIPLSGEWRFQVEAVSKGTTSISPNSYPTLLFNAMVKPLIPIGIKGVIWYQGETNAERAYQYRKAFPLMIQDWRKQWGEGDFPFYFVQLSSYNANNGNSDVGSSWAELREAQTLTLSVPNTGMAVTIDIGDPHDIHPRNKQDVGKRLAALALNRTYQKTRTDSGPSYKSFAINGNQVIVSFAGTGSGLIAKDRYGYVKGFELAGADHKFHYAKASIQGDVVVVSCDAVPQPVAIRYGWADDASDANLYNREGFPAIPFRTDTWDGITDRVKYTF